MTNQDLSGVQLNLVESLDEANEFMRWLGERRDSKMALDTETGGLHWWRDPLRLVQFGDAMTGWAIPWDDWGGLVKEALRRYDYRIVLHNARFDLHYLEHNGCDVPRYHLDDTMVMAHLLDSTQPVGLKSLGSRHIHRAAAAGEVQLKEAMRSNRWGWDTVPVDFPAYWQYGALDCVITSRLDSIFDPLIQADEGLRRVYNLESEVSLVLADMERRGTHVDLDYIKTKREELAEYALATRAWATEEYGVKNPNSNKQVVERLQRDGIRFTSFTDKGNVKLDEEVLTSLDHPLAAATLNIRKAEKLVGSYLDNLVDLADGDVVHCNIRALGARTGRMSVTQPALQTLPRGPVIRDCFVPRPGYSMVLTDYDQVELRVMAHYADEETMIEAIHAGVDLHTYTMQQVYGDPTLTKDDPRRQLAKNSGFAKIYGAGVRQFAKTSGVTEEEAQQFLDLYDRTYPRVGQFIKEVEQVGRSRLMGNEGYAYVRTQFGRRQRCEPDALYRLVNYLIQGTCADLLKQKIVDLDRVGLGEYLLLPVHDEVVAEVPTPEAEAISKEIKHAMEDHESFRVPLTCEGKIVDRWGAAYR